MVRSEFILSTPILSRPRSSTAATVARPLYARSLIAPAALGERGYNFGASLSPPLLRATVSPRSFAAA